MKQSQYQIPEMLDIFELTTNNTVADLKQVFPKAKLLDNALDSDIIDIREPLFPFYIRRALVGEREVRVDFSEYFISEAADTGFLLLLFKYRTPEYIKEASLPGHF